MAGVDNLTPFTGADDPHRSNGRPKGIPNAKTRYQRILTLITQMPNPVTGDLEDFTQIELMDMKVMQQALKGDLKAYQEVMDRLEGRAQQKVKMDVGRDPVDEALEKLGLLDEAKNDRQDQGTKKKTP